MFNIVIKRKIIQKNCLQFWERPGCTRKRTCMRPGNRHVCDLKAACMRPGNRPENRIMRPGNRRVCDLENDLYANEALILYISAMIGVFNESLVLRPCSKTLWVNVVDSFSFFGSDWKLLCSEYENINVKTYRLPFMFR